MAEENERLRDRVAFLEETLAGGSIPLPLEWSLTVSETRVFCALMAREMASKEAILGALYRDRGADEAEIKIVDVFICKIRKKVAPFGIKIETVWGQGYRLSTSTKATVRQLTECAAAA